MGFQNYLDDESNDSNDQKQKKNTLSKLWGNVLNHVEKATDDIKALDKTMNTVRPADSSSVIPAVLKKPKEILPIVESSVDGSAYQAAQGSKLQELRSKINDAAPEPIVPAKLPEKPLIKKSNTSATKQSAFGISPIETKKKQADRSRAIMTLFPKQITSFFSDKTTKHFSGEQMEARQDVAVMEAQNMDNIEDEPMFTDGHGDGVGYDGGSHASTGGSGDEGSGFNPMDLMSQTMAHLFERDTAPEETPETSQKTSQAETASVAKKPRSFDLNLDINPKVSAHKTSETKSKTKTKSFDDLNFISSSDKTMASVQKISTPTRVSSVSPLSSYEDEGDKPMFDRVERYRDDQVLDDERLEHIDDSRTNQLLNTNKFLGDSIQNLADNYFSSCDEEIEGGQHSR